MKLSEVFGLFFGLTFSVKTGFLPTLKAILASPRLLLTPRVISRIFMSHVWAGMAGPVDERARVVKQDLITPNARGVVLDLGAGHGHTLKYLDSTKVTKYIALEPNTFMHPQIRKAAAEAGYSEITGTFVVLGCGAEDVESIFASVGGAPHAIDTIVSVLTLCSVPSPRETLAALIRDVLKPGGIFLFHEHVLSPRADVAWWQNFWNPLWSTVFDGCCLNRPTHLWVQGAGGWREARVWGEADDEENLFIHKTGSFTKESLPLS